MTAINEKTFFTALGFLTLLVKGEETQIDGVARAGALGKLIESFCQSEKNHSTAAAQSNQNPEVFDKIIELLKDNLEHAHEAKLPNDLPTLQGVYERLIQRHRAYAHDDMIADAVLYFLEEENEHVKEANMMIIRVQGEDDIFTPCQGMATAIAEILKTKGACNPSDLEAKGFSPSEVKRHWSMAYALAKVELNWMDA